ncbi:hypothetical protein NDU88_002809 [Pleurodeles waltl]|uniref:Uncharacterized protein n=1 Tax=Pleurodeles waltl TaxID=8319 RepID=A0AAV7T3D3_PLEWA|nr:hypothetical protein NDU88_002809 [Pleurodeles waltl]
MMEAMHSFMASAKAIAGLGADEQGASSRRGTGVGTGHQRDANGTGRCFRVRGGGSRRGLTTYRSRRER